MRRFRKRGFTLTELAVTAFIVSGLVVAIVLAVGTGRDVAQNNVTAAGGALSNYAGLSVDGESGAADLQPVVFDTSGVKSILDSSYFTRWDNEQSPTVISPSFYAENGDPVLWSVSYLGFAYDTVTKETFILTTPWGSNSEIMASWPDAPGNEPYQLAQELYLGFAEALFAAGYKLWDNNMDFYFWYCSDLTAADPGLCPAEEYFRLYWLGENIVTLANGAFQSGASVSMAAAIFGLYCDTYDPTYWFCENL